VITSLLTFSTRIVFDFTFSTASVPARRASAVTCTVDAERIGASTETFWMLVMFTVLFTTVSVVFRSVSRRTSTVCCA